MTGQSFDLDGDQAKKVKAYFEQLKALDEEAQDIAARKRELLAAAKDNDLDKATLTLMVRRARKSHEELIEADRLLETYEVLAGTGAAEVGVLAMERGEDGTFRPKMVTGADAAAEKLTRAKKNERDAVMLAELARRARAEDL